MNSAWDMIDQIMHSPWAGPTVSGRAVLIQAGLLSFVLLIAMWWLAEVRVVASLLARLQRLCCRFS